MRKFLLFGGAAFVVASSLVVSPATAGAQSAVLTVVKEVQGTAPADAVFEIVVDCTLLANGPAGRPQGEVDPIGILFEFGPEGGEGDLPILGPVECTIVEVDDGGADQVIGGNQTIVIDQLVDRTVTVTNVFGEQPTTTTTTLATTTTTSAAATWVTTAPRFTG
ncbi:hypothetical protein [Rhabdothermincola sediminis]|uniref:hypothetical protein n=1 Tax=Rhabdothermincola sediminis TaxID=2751370 RepID=UPI001AA05FC5|nr:hypothetical protein [Rhabdothermincola sediminis]